MPFVRKMATWSNLNIQDSASPLIEQLIFFHDHTLIILTIITILVGYLIITLFFNKLINRYLLEGQTIEVIWTILPAITLVFIACRVFGATDQSTWHLRTTNSYECIFL